MQALRVGQLEAGIHGHPFSGRLSLLGDAGLNTRVTERGPALVLGGLLHTRWPLVCSCEVKLRNVANLIGEARYTPATQQK